jgi:hypothetical protein
LDEDALRQLVREAIRQHLGPPVPSSTPVVTMLPPSHARFQVPPGDGPCRIEPAVACVHCGYCQSLGY